MIDLKVTLGTVNYVNYLHVVAAKVSSPNQTVWESWIKVPVSNFNFVIPNLDPTNYYVRYYDAATNTALGSLISELLVNATTGELILERKFYLVNGTGPADPIDTATKITDPYLIGKNVTGFFKEGFRYYEPNQEYTFNGTIGEVDFSAAASSLGDGEKVIIEIKYTGTLTSTNPTALTGLYSTTITVTEASRLLLTSEKNARVRLFGSGTSQTVTLCSLASIANDEGFYFDNTVLGTAWQVKLLTAGTDVIKYNGFSLTGNGATAPESLTEFWVSRGEHLLIRKFSLGAVSNWEIISDYKGNNVGEKVSVSNKDQPGILPEDGRLVSAAEYPRLYWWLLNVLPATHKYYISNIGVGFVPSIARRGQFAFQTGLVDSFRMPDTRNMFERGLANFDTYGSDVANRPNDFPGGFQNEMILEHAHSFIKVQTQGSGTISGYVNGRNVGDVAKSTELFGGQEQRVKNTGVIFGRRI